MLLFLKAISAAFCSFLCVNFICMFYYSAPGDLYRDNGATKSIRVPDSIYVNVAEGFGITYYDQNGYNNLAGKLEKPYVLIMGSSHMEATYVLQEKNTASVLNYLLGGTNKKLRVYNIAHADNPLPALIKGFQAGIGEFPDAGAVVMEVYSTNFSVIELKNSLQQTIYSTDSDGAYLLQHLTAEQRLRSTLIGWMPYLKYVLGRQFASVNLGFGNPFGLFDDTEMAEMPFEENAYESALNDAFSLLRREYNKPLIILYHPEITFSEDQMLIVRDECTYNIFKDVCEKNNIIFIDTGDAFLEAYADEYVVPYGYNNTVIGHGHLNADGHEIVAKILYQTLKDMQEVY